MAARELVVLGTASQVPTRHRNHNGYFLRWDDEGLLFDPGEGTQRQLLPAGVPSTAITRMCVTHFHGDHALGVPGSWSPTGGGCFRTGWPRPGSAARTSAGCSARVLSSSAAAPFGWRTSVRPAAASGSRS